MKDINLERYLQGKYGDSFTLKQLLEDQELLEMLPKGTIPKIEITQNCGYVNMRDTVFNSQTILKFLYIYVNGRGEITTTADQSFSQIPPSWKGYLARFSVPANQKIAENMSLDYLIDIQKIRYRIPSTIDQRQGSIVYSNTIELISEQPINTPDKNWAPVFIDSSSREEFFRTWFQNE